MSRLYFLMQYQAPCRVQVTAAPPPAPPGGGVQMKDHGELEQGHFLAQMSPVWIAHSR